MIKKDLIIGCIAHYSYENIRNWVKSIDFCGFSGDKIVIAYNLDSNVINFLNDNGFQVYETELYMNIVVQRFADVWRLLNEINIEIYEWVIFTDVKDVIFQTNPSVWLKNNMTTHNFVAASESLLYKDEDWAIHNMKESFGYEIYEWMSNKCIYNAGTIAGKINFIKDLFLINYIISLAGKSHNPDQASLNILLATSLLSNSIKFANNKDAWACQLGTTMDPNKINKYSKKLIESPPIIKNDILLVNDNDVEYCIVHQYDRVPKLKQKLDEIYK